MISSAIAFFTSELTSFQCLTPMSGAFNLVYMTTSSTNVRRLSPKGPPRDAENWIFSFCDRAFALLACAASPFKEPHPTFLPPMNNQKIKPFIWAFSNTISAIIRWLIIVKPVVIILTFLAWDGHCSGGVALLPLLSQVLVASSTMLA